MIFLFMKTQKKSLFSTTLPKTHLINFFLFLLSLIYKICLNRNYFFQTILKRNQQIIQRKGIHIQLV
jgi:hypothetical protein